MKKLFVCNRNPSLVIGRVYRGLKGPHGYDFLPNQRIKVVGKATEEDWIDCNVAWGGPRDHYEMIAKINGPWYYYEIQTD